METMRLPSLPPSPPLSGPQSLFASQVSSARSSERGSSSRSSNSRRARRPSWVCCRVARDAHEQEQQRRPWLLGLAACSAVVVVVVCVTVVSVAALRSAVQEGASSVLRTSGTRAVGVSSLKGNQPSNDPSVEFQPPLLQKAGLMDQSLANSHRGYSLGSSKPEDPSWLSGAPGQKTRLTSPPSRRDVLKGAGAAVAGVVAGAIAGPKQANAMEAFIQCPGAPPSPVRGAHAQASLYLNAEAACADVQEEVRARVSGKNGWRDPHMNGEYKMISDEVVNDARTSLTGRMTMQRDVNMMTFTFSNLDGEDGGCQVTACSETQAADFFDRSTNYCNLRNLYCGPKDGCAVAVKDIGLYKEVKKGFSVGAGKDKTECNAAEAASPLKGVVPLSMLV